MTEREQIEVLRKALVRLHDECCIEKGGKRLDVGPMMAPSEQSVLYARAALSASSSPAEVEPLEKVLLEEWDEACLNAILEPAVTEKHPDSVHQLCEAQSKVIFAAEHWCDQVDLNAYQYGLKKLRVAIEQFRKERASMATAATPAVPEARSGEDSGVDCDCSCVQCQHEEHNSCAWSCDEDIRRSTTHPEQEPKP